MISAEEQIKIQYLRKIKKAVDNDVDGNTFIILRRKKNLEFIRKYGLKTEDIKNIIRKLSTEDFLAGPKISKNFKYEDLGFIFIFNPKFEDITLYIKIQVENTGKSICISIHEFGKYDGEVS